MDIGADFNADGFNVVVYSQGDGRGAQVEHRTTGKRRASLRPYGSKDAAKLAAFAVMLGRMEHVPAGLCCGFIEPEQKSEASRRWSRARRCRGRGASILGTYGGLDRSGRHAQNFCGCMIINQTGNRYTS